MTKDSKASAQETMEKGKFNCAKCGDNVYRGRQSIIVCDQRLFEICDPCMNRLIKCLLPEFKN